ncbi:MAG: hypothetical protein GWP15_01845 [Nitrospirae bacterium]|nr:hypothetical protein [Nitrospirota bacterium]
MELFPLISIPVLYLFVAFLKPYFQPKIPFKICAICIAVSLTWLGMLVMLFLRKDVSLVTLGILMGMSVVGIMYRLEDFYKKKKIQNFWMVRLVVVVGGFYAVRMLLEQEWNWFLMIIIGSLVVMVFATVFFQGITHRDVTKRLDDCC